MLYCTTTVGTAWTPEDAARVADAKLCGILNREGTKVVHLAVTSYTCRQDDGAKHVYMITAVVDCPANLPLPG